MVSMVVDVEPVPLPPVKSVSATKLPAVPPPELIWIMGVGVGVVVGVGVGVLVGVGVIVSVEEVRAWGPGWQFNH